MLFTRIPHGSRIPKGKHHQVFLTDDNWNDYGFETTFYVTIIDDDGAEHYLGAVCIMTKGMSHGRVNVPASFEEPLGEEYCSLGQKQNYYETLALLPIDIRNEYLISIRDCVYDLSIYQAFRGEKAMQDSLLRSVSSSAVETTFRNALLGNAILTPYHFEFKIEPDEVVDEVSNTLEIKVEPNSLPPTNIHAVIGRNGVGKTRLFAGIMHNLLRVVDESGYALKGDFTFRDQWADDGQQFANLVTVSFSAFDSFEPISNELGSPDISYNYVGLKIADVDEKDERSFRVRTPSDLKEEFQKSLFNCLQETRIDRFMNVMEILCSDPGIRSIGISELLERRELSKTCEVLGDEFEHLSSGHKIVLLTATKLVELVDERTLVLLDEPESHLHPPLLGSLVRAISELLVQRNGVGILATHSPVVLQEIPKSCITFIRKTEDKIHLSEPDDETFAENVGILTREAFGLEVTESGFHKLLAKVSEGKSYEEVLQTFGNNIGAEGRAIVRAMTSKKEA